MSDDAMPKAYEPAKAEEKWYSQWESRGYFEAHADSQADAYTIVIPPPNVTGVLTLGHVLNNTLQDILIRFEKMRGKEICWVPGTDHAGIATQAKVEAHLRETENLSRTDLGREEFLERVWQWKREYGGTIIRQLRRLGTACDWRRERFTLDEGLSNAVQDVFIRLYERGLIYKGTRMINWCPMSRTALSDEEVIYQTERGFLWYMKYPVVGGSDTVSVATTRPETMLGDTAVAINPDDERYQHLLGKTIMLPLVKREIPVIADQFVDKAFGTGIVKVTPGHDPNDYEMGVRHDLEMINVMNDDGTMNENAGADFQGMDRYECRAAVVECFTELGLLEKTEVYEHQVGFSERGHVAVEPRLSEQWFVRMQPLAEPAIKAVNDGRIKFYPERWIKTYNHWMENIKDWCISRQLWWGHRIPAYTCDGCGEIAVSREPPTVCAKCGGAGLTQDEDVLDTWFSSWLWPFSVFDWPRENADLARFYPTQTLVTGPDIIFFWVARMIMSGIEFMGAIPFSKVYYTSIIRDDQGRKLSKSLNNSPDPLNVIDTYGADALRFTVIYISPLGQDIRYSDKKCEIGRNFANKLWNAARFRAMQGPITQEWNSLSGADLGRLRPDDRWILARTDEAVRSITTDLDAFDFHSYSISLYQFIWNRFCDWYVESAKASFYGDDAARKQTTLKVFDFVFSRILRLMHPVMPFVTEEIYHQLDYVTTDDSIMLTAWPESFLETISTDGLFDRAVIDMVDEKFGLISAGRNLRGSYNIPGGRKIPYYIRPTDAGFSELLRADMDSVKLLLNAEAVTVDTDYDPQGTVPSAVEKHGVIYMPLEGVINIGEEVKRLGKQRDELCGVIRGIAAKLSNKKFLTRAPPDVVENERTRCREFEEKMQEVDALLAGLQ